MSLTEKNIILIFLNVFNVTLTKVFHPLLFIQVFGQPHLVDMIEEGRYHKSLCKSAHTSRNKYHGN